MNPNDVPFQPSVFAGQIAFIFGGLFFLLLGSAIFYTIAVWRFRGQQVEGEIIGGKQYFANEHAGVGAMGEYSVDSEACTLVC